MSWKHVLTNICQHQYEAEIFWSWITYKTNQQILVKYEISHLISYDRCLMGYLLASTARPPAHHHYHLHLHPWSHLCARKRSDNNPSHVSFDCSINTCVIVTCGEHMYHEKKWKEQTVWRIRHQQGFFKRSHVNKHGGLVLLISCQILSHNRRDLRRNFVISFCYVSCHWECEQQRAAWIHKYKLRRGASLSHQRHALVCISGLSARRLSSCLTARLDRGEPGTVISINPITVPHEGRHGGGRKGGIKELWSDR